MAAIGGLTTSTWGPVRGTWTHQPQGMRFGATAPLGAAWLRAASANEAGHAGQRGLGLGGTLPPLTPRAPAGPQLAKACGRGHQVFAAAAAQWLPLSAREGVRRQSGDAARMPREEPDSARSTRGFGAPDPDREMLRVCQQIGWKAAQKYRTARDALRYVDADRDGQVDQSEMRYFFRAYDFPDKVADHFFDHLRNGRPTIEYDQFVSCFWPYIEQAVGGKLIDNQGGASDASISPDATISAPGLDLGELQKEFGKDLETIGTKAAQKFRNLRHAFRFVDSDHDGSISKAEMRSFYRAFNLPEQSADRFYDRLDEDRSGDVSFQEFVKHLGPYIHPDHKPEDIAIATEQHRRGRKQWSAPNSDASRDTAATSLLGFRSAEVDAESEALEAAQRTLRPVLEDIARILPLKFKFPRDAFRVLDLERNGRITRVEMQSFFRGFGHSEEVADRIFDLLDDELEGEVNYAAFMSNFDCVLGPQFRRAHRAPLISVDDPRLEKEVNAIAVAIRERLTTKYRDLRDAFRALDLDKDGSVSRTELRTFFKSFGMPPGSADKFFTALDEDDSGSVQYDEFVRLFGDVGISDASHRTHVSPRRPMLRRLG